MEASSLSYLGFERVAPSPVLREYVQCYWLIQRGDLPATQRQEFWRPDGGVGLVFNLGDDLCLDSVQFRPRLFLDGVNTVSKSVAFCGNVAAFGVRFQPGGAYPFLGTRLSAVMDQNLTLDDLELPGVHQVHERLCVAASADEKAAIVEEWLLHRMRESRGVAPVVQASIELIRRSKGQSAIAEVAAGVTVSQRQLERLYQAQVGMTPKRYARILRVEAARHVLSAAPFGPTAEVAYLAGYYDQAHFIREFKAIVGLTPKRYAARVAARRRGLPPS